MSRRDLGRSLGLQVAIDLGMTGMCTVMDMQSSWRRWMLQVMGRHRCGLMLVIVEREVTST